MKRILLIVFSLISLSLFSSCNEEEIIKKVDSKTQTKEVYKGETFSLNLGVSTSRSFTLGDPDGNGKAQIIYKKGDSIKLTCALYSPQHPEYTSYGELKGVITKGSEYSKDNDPKVTSADMSFRGELQLKDGSISSGDWYLQAFIADNTIKIDETSHTLSMPNQVVDINKLKTINVPLASNWIKLTVKNVDGENSASGTLNCNPLGNIVSFVISSPLYDKLDVTKIELENSLFDSEGTFKFNIPTTPNSAPSGLPIWTPKTNEAMSRISLQMKNFSFKGGTEAETSPRIYFWGMPKKSAMERGGSLTGYIFISNDTSEKGLKTTTIKTTAKIKSGKTYQLGFSLPESDLMITELFHNNPGDKYNKSMIELYNPTKHTIDLNNYALIKERAITKRTPKDYGASWGLHKNRGNHTYYLSGFQPGDQYNILEEALKQDLYISPDMKDKAAHMLGGQPVTETISYGRDSYDKSRFKSRYKIISQSGRGYSNILDPGKTIILCSSYYYAHDNYKPNQIVGPYIDKAVDKKNCQFIITVNNGVHEDSNNQYDTGGGPMDQGRFQIMVLCKLIEKGGINRYKPIDATGPLMYYTAIKYHPEITEDFQIIKANKDNPEDDYSLGKTALTKYETSENSLHICDGEIGGNESERAEKMYNRFEIYKKFFPNTRGSSVDDTYDLVRKDFALYPTPVWDNNKYNDYKWDKDSQWILVSDVAAGASLVSSLGTRALEKSYFTGDSRIYNFLKNYIVTGTNYYQYFIFPISYNENPIGGGFLTGYNKINEEITH